MRVCGGVAAVVVVVQFVLALPVELVWIGPTPESFIVPFVVPFVLQFVSDVPFLPGIVRVYSLWLVSEFTTSMVILGLSFAKAAGEMRSKQSGGIANRLEATRVRTVMVPPLGIERMIQSPFGGQDYGQFPLLKCQ